MEIQYMPITLFPYHSSCCFHFACYCLSPSFVWLVSTLLRSSWPRLPTSMRWLMSLIDLTVDLILSNWSTTCMFIIDNGLNFFKLDLIGLVDGLTLNLNSINLWSPLVVMVVLPCGSNNGCAMTMVVMNKYDYGKKRLKSHFEWKISFILTRTKFAYNSIWRNSPLTHYMSII